MSRDWFKKFKMICEHCEGEFDSGVTVQYVDSGRVGFFCDLNCQMACKRDWMIPGLNRLMKYQESDSDALKTMTELVKHGFGHLSTLDVAVSKDPHGNMIGVRRTTEKDKMPTKQFKEMELVAQSIGDRLVYLKMEKKLDGLRKKTVQYLLARNLQMYTLFKAKWFDEWVEFLSLSVNDVTAQKEGEKMKETHSFLKTCEFLFFWKEGKEKELTVQVETELGTLDVVDFTRIY